MQQRAGIVLLILITQCQGLLHRGDSLIGVIQRFEFCFQLGDFIRPQGHFIQLGKLVGE